MKTEQDPTLYPLPDDALGIIWSASNSEPFAGKPAWQSFAIACGQRDKLNAQVSELIGALEMAQSDIAGWIESTRNKSLKEIRSDILGALSTAMQARQALADAKGSK